MIIDVSKYLDAAFSGCGLPLLFQSEDRPCHPRREKEKILDVVARFA